MSKRGGGRGRDKYGEEGKRETKFAEKKQEGGLEWTENISEAVRLTFDFFRFFVVVDEDEDRASSPIFCSIHIRQKNNGIEQ
jgi:hypothetical protein